MNSRRSFVKQSLLGGIAVGGFGFIPSEAFAKNEMVKITILHTNDVHSRIEPFPDNDPKYPDLGGVARRAALIKKIRNEERNVLLLDAGDVFQGTPYFNKFGGELEMKLMSRMNYDACAIGNHDFDNGVDGLSSQLIHANFPFVCANYDFSKTSLHGKTIPYKIFNKQGIKIGVFGLGIELEGLVDKRMYGNTIYIDAFEKAQTVSKHLKREERCDLIICLSHLGFKYEGKKLSDLIIAKYTKNIDLIIGGHTHTFLSEPVRIKNQEGEETLVCQAGWAGVNLGRIDYYFERKTKIKKAEGLSIKVSKNAIAI